MNTPKIALGILAGFWLILISEAFFIGGNFEECKKFADTPINSVPAKCYPLFAPIL